ncbi:MAG: hypothetical protein QRY72_00620 [Candidatus Rhabdochlamydia sp.]
MSTLMPFPLETSPEVFIQHSSILNLQEGKNLLQQLSVGSKDYLCLQDLLVKTTGIFEITIKNVSYKINTVSADCQLLGGFGGSEHFDIGHKASHQDPKGLKGLDTQFILTVEDQPLEFSHIVALAGDFYGVPGQAIAFGVSEDDKIERFLNAFKRLAGANIKELKSIVSKITDEHAVVSHSGTPHHCYGRCNLEGLRSFSILKHDYDDLLADNSDHFEKNAQEAYRIGHKLALQKAREGGREGNLDKLKEAYALDAFACHFLTDLFASGHIRNQRGDLEKFLTAHLTSYISTLKSYSFEKIIIKKIVLGSVKQLAGALTGAQHEEDGKRGLKVHNQNKKNQWMAYGDGTYFRPEKEANKTRVVAATEASIDEVHQAYTYYQREITSCMEDFMPNPLPFGAGYEHEKSNHFPVYEIKNDELILYKNDQPQPLQKGLGLIKNILNHALHFAPEAYIKQIVMSQIEKHTTDRLKDILHIKKEPSPWASKVIKPIFDEFRNFCFGPGGITKAESDEMKDMVDEVGATACDTNQNVKLMLEEFKKLREDLASVKKSDWTSFNEAKLEIKHDVELIKHQSTLAEKDGENERSFRKKRIKNIYNKAIILSNYLNKDEKEGIFLAECKKQLRNKNPDAIEEEIMLRVALWFQDALKIQAEACLYYSSYEDTEKMPFMDKQLKIAKIFFNNENQEPKIQECSPSYIALQLRKIEKLKTPNFDPKNEK